MRLFFIIFLFTTINFAKISDKEIANMFILGFYGSGQNICSDLQKGLGGVIVFQKSPINRKKIKNFSSANSLKELTTNIKICGDKPLIAVDQEGGLVQRVKLSKKYPKASVVSQKGEFYARYIYNKMAKELNSLGINFNLAPVADLAINPKNVVINRFGRSYSKDAKSVIKYDSIFIDSMHRFNVATSLKHFPGHGSSLGDTHKGFVDVTNLWKKVELEPYYALKNKTDTVMVAHIYNKKLDSIYPASLSKRIVQKILRDKIGFNKVVISDDLQMGAIAKHYSLKQRVKLSINAGVDIMLFANQVHPKRVIKLDRLIKIVRELLDNGEISPNSIKRANLRINKLKQRLY